MLLNSLVPPVLHISTLYLESRVAEMVAAELASAAHLHAVPLCGFSVGEVPLAGWIQILAYCAYCEIAADYDSDFKKRTSGDMGWNPPLFSIGDAEVKKRRLASEIANGRLAMMAIIGMFFQAHVCLTCVMRVCQLSLLS